MNLREKMAGKTARRQNTEKTDRRTVQNSEQKMTDNRITKISPDTLLLIVRHVTGNDQDYLRKSPKWLFRYLRFSKRATVGVRATYATR